MWRTLANPVLHRPVAIIRIPSSGNSISSFHGIENFAAENDANEATNSKNSTTGITNGNKRNLSKAQAIISGLLTGKQAIKYTRTKTFEQLLDINFYLQQIRDKRQGLCVSENADALVLCSPANERSDEKSGFWFRNICSGIEKWCYGVVVVSGLLLCRRLFFNHDIRDGKNHISRHIGYNDGFPDLHSHILPVNGPPKAVDPVDAAFSSLGDVVRDSTAVTENVLGVQFSALNMPEKALAYFKSASSKGNSAAHFNMGICHEKGIGTDTNISKAIDSYSYAASLGHSKAAYNLGGIYLEGKHVTQERDKGLKLMEKAADSGLLEAQRFLGLYYADQSNEHYNMNVSVKWLQAAAEKNDVTAQYHLGICYERGLGVRRNMKQARIFYQQAAKHGHTGAQHNIGVFHEYGLGGLTVDKQEALRWYKMASHAGNINAKHNLSCLEREFEDLKKDTIKSGLLRKLLQDTQDLVSSAVLPRCSSSPGRLYVPAELSKDIPEHRQHGTNEDTKCIWVI